MSRTSRMTLPLMAAPRRPAEMRRAPRVLGRPPGGEGAPRGTHRAPLRNARQTRSRQRPYLAAAADQKWLAAGARRIDAEVRSLSCHPAHGRVRIFHRTRELRFGREPVADRDDHAATVVREGPARSVGATKTPDHPTPAVEVHQRGCGRLRRPVDADGERAAGTGNLPLDDRADGFGCRAQQGRKASHFLWGQGRVRGSVGDLFDQRARRRREPILSYGHRAIRSGAAYTLKRSSRRKPMRVIPKRSAVATARLDGAPTAARIGIPAATAFWTTS